MRAGPGDNEEASMRGTISSLRGADIGYTIERAALLSACWVCEEVVARRTGKQIVRERGKGGVFAAPPSEAEARRPDENRTPIYSYDLVHVYTPPRQFCNLFLRECSIDLRECSMQTSNVEQGILRE
jgi:hypothetical protein